MEPRWYFTGEHINRYLSGAIKRWDIETIGALMEAFAIAGGEVMGMLPSSILLQPKTDHIRIC